MRSPLSATMLRNLRSNCQHWNKTLREQVQQQQQQQQQEEMLVQQQQRQSSPSSSPASSVGAHRLSPQHHHTETSSLEEMAELEMQRPDVLQKRRASSSGKRYKLFDGAKETYLLMFVAILALPRSRSPRSSMHDLPRRVSLPVSTSGGATLWTVSANRRLYEALSTSDIANAPVRLRLSHSEVAEEPDDEISRGDDIAEGEEEEEEGGGTSEAKGNDQRSEGACSGSGCGTPTSPPPAIVVSTSATQDWSTEGMIYSVVEKNFSTLMTTPSPQQQQRRYSEPLVLTFASLCPVPAKSSKPTSSAARTKPQTDENGRLSNLMLLQRCMPRRGSLPMTQKELEDVQAVSGATLSLGTRSNSSGPQPVPALGRAVDVS